MFVEREEEGLHVKICEARKRERERGKREGY